MSQQQQYTWEQIKQHNTVESCWIVIKEKVYDVTKFVAMHPGGAQIILEYAGQDATADFNLFHPQDVLMKYEKLVIGVIANAKGKQIAPIQKYNPNAYGECIPYGDPNNVQGWYSPYYTENHKQLRLALREFIEKELVQGIQQWDENYKIPKEVVKKCAEQGLFALIVGGPWPEKYYSEKKVCGVTIEKQDMFHEIIVYEELSRTGSGGLMWAVIIGTGIGLPPIIKFGNDDLKSRYVPQCLTGEKQICLAVTEPWAGSDVANLKTTAIKSPCGKFYIVNGMKKFITNGIFADCFTTAVRTGGPGNSGVSMLVIDRNLPGVKCRKMQMTGVWCSCTTYIVFDNVKVPVENLIGKEGEGFKYTMVNFNHERLQISAQAIAMARCAYEECMKHAHRRKTFGKYLIEHPVIRNKLAHMIRQIEASQNFLENCVYNFDKMSPEQSVKQLSGAVGLLKAQSTQTMEFCVREAVQIFGGQGYQRNGVGGKVERLFRDAKAMTLGGGSEEILLDLGVRQASKIMPSL